MSSRPSCNGFVTACYGCRAGHLGANLPTHRPPPSALQSRPTAHRLPCATLQAFEELLPYANFSLRLQQADIPNLPQILGSFSNASWLQMRRNLACVWPRMLWLQTHGIGGGLTGGADARGARDVLQDEELKSHDAWATLMETLRARTARRRGQPEKSFDWKVPTRSCAAVGLLSEGSS